MSSLSSFCLYFCNDLDSVSLSLLSPNRNLRLKRSVCCSHTSLSLTSSHESVVNLSCGLSLCIRFCLPLNMSLGLSTNINLTPSFIINLSITFSLNFSCIPSFKFRLNYILNLSLNLKLNLSIIISPKPNVEWKPKNQPPYHSMSKTQSQYQS